MYVNNVVVVGNLTADPRMGEADGKVVNFRLAVNRWTYFVLTTRGVDIDVPGLPSLLASPAAYIGVIGSRRRWATTRQQLLDKGVPEEALERIHSPMGLELRAETPEEIAVSILAEIIQVMHREDER